MSGGQAVASGRQAHASHVAHARRHRFDGTAGTKTKARVLAASRASFPRATLLLAIHAPSALRRNSSKKVAEARQTVCARSAVSDKWNLTAVKAPNSGAVAAVGVAKGIVHAVSFVRQVVSECRTRIRPTAAAIAVGANTVNTPWAVPPKLNAQPVLCANRATKKHVHAPPSRTAYAFLSFVPHVLSVSTRRAASIRTRARLKIAWLIRPILAPASTVSHVPQAKCVWAAAALKQGVACCAKRGPILSTALAVYLAAPRSALPDNSSLLIAQPLEIGYVPCALRRLDGALRANTSRTAEKRMVR